MNEPNECPWVTVEGNVCGAKCWGTVYCNEHQRAVDEANEDFEFVLFKMEYDLRNKDKD